MGAERGEGGVACGGVAEGPARRGRGRAEAEVESEACLGRPGTDAVRAGKGRAGPRQVLESSRKEKVQGQGTTVGDVPLVERGGGSREHPQCGGGLLHQAKSSTHLTHHAEGRGKIQSPVSCEHRADVLPPSRDETLHLGIAHTQVRGKLPCDLIVTGRPAGAISRKHDVGEAPNPPLNREKSCEHRADVLPPSRNDNLHHGIAKTPISNDDRLNLRGTCDANALSHGFASGKDNKNNRNHGHSPRRHAAPVSDLARVECDQCSSAETRMPDFTIPYNPSFEILLCSGKVLSPWRRIWESNPLVLHDKNFVRCLSPCSELYDLTVLISAILENHPGPVLYFRIDSSQWTGGQWQLSKWLKTLSEKLASEVVIINRAGNIDLEFPFLDIQSSCLKCLRVGFFALSNLEIGCFDYRMLHTLQLIGCIFDTMRLYHVVEKCSNLTHLEVGLSLKDIKLHSQSLKYLQIWKCRMRHLLIEFAPKLCKVVLGAHPRPKEQSMLLTVKEAPLLLQFEYLLLPFHTVKEKWWMKTVKELKLGVQMASCTQRKNLCDVIVCASCLQEFVLWRMDDIDVTEELDVIVDGSLNIISSCPPLNELRTFTIEDFRAGGSEIAFAVAVLKSATQLNYLHVFACSGSSQELIKKAIRELRRKERRSKNCSIVQQEATNG